MECNDSTLRGTSLGDQIANAVLSKFENLSLKHKPAKMPDGSSQWVPLSGIVLEDSDGSLECVSLATGMKCLPASKIPLAHGRILHDSHAEILALRAFNYLLLQECANILENQNHSSNYLIDSEANGVPFTIRPSIRIHMYCSEAPCGDASMELIMQKQDDSRPWTDAPPTEGLLGRSHFSKLGIVRRKPARGDSPESLSKSCSDKLAMRQCTSILSSHTSRFIMPQNAYLTSIVIPESQYVPHAATRCFSQKGRMKAVADLTWKGGYSFHPFQCLTTSKEFKYSRRGMLSQTSSPKPSNLAAVWTPYSEESMINGVLQGRKQEDPHAASMLSRIMLVKEARRIIGNDGPNDTSTYAELKSCHPQNIARAMVKTQVINEALPGWVRNVQDCFQV